jgi:LmbE family N-acetylglucosaminyl deacetylase
MKNTEFAEFARKLVNEFGENVFTQPKLHEVWDVFCKVPDIYAQQIAKWAFQYFDTFKPCTPEWLISESQRALNFHQTQTSKRSSEPRFEYNADAQLRTVKEYGFNSVEELIANNFRPRNKA